MNLFIRYHCEQPDLELDEEIVSNFQELGFQMTFNGYDNSAGSRDIYFERYDPFEDMESKEIH